MTPCAQIQLELFGLPGLAGPRSLFDGRSVAHLAGCVASSALSYCFQVFKVRPIGFDLFKDQPTNLQISSVPHNQPSVAETMSPTEQVTLCATTIHKSRNQRAGR